MSYGVSANGIDPTVDYGAILSNRAISAPKRRTVTKTVPYSDGFYDYSEIDGRAFYESRTAEYVLTVVGDTEDVARRAAQIESWAYGIGNDDLYDELYPGWHLVASIQSVTTKWIGRRSAAVTVKLLCQPFKYANDETEVTLPIGETVIYNKGHAALLTGTSEGACILTIGNASQSFTGEDIELELALEHGENAVTVAGSACTLKWREAVI